MKILRVFLDFVVWFCAFMVSVAGGLALGCIVALGPNLNTGHPATLGLKIEIWMLAGIGFLLSAIRLFRYNDDESTAWYVLAFLLAATILW